MDRGLNLIICIEPFGNRMVPLRGRRLSLGRGTDQDLCIPDRKISSAHALLEPTDTGYRLRDLGSTNGTYLNGQLVSGLAELEVGDEVRFGNTLVLLTDKDLSEIGEWPGPGSRSSEGDPLDAGPRPVSDPDLGVRTVRFKLPDVERHFLESDEGALGSVRLQRKLQVLYRMTVVARGHVSDPQSLLEEALGLVFEAIDADRGAFFLRGESGELEEVATKARSGKAQGGRISRSMLEQVLDQEEAILSRDVFSDQRFDANHSIFRTNIRSALAVPLRGQEAVLGVLHLDKRDARRPFDEEDLHLAVIVAQQVAGTLHNARLFAEVRRANRELEAARDEILRWNQDLEQKVAARTREVQAQAAKIAELNKQKDQLLGMVAHDLRTPLAGLLGFAEVAIDGIEQGIAPEKTKEDLEIIRVTALEMSELLSDLLDVARIEAGKLSIDPREVDLAVLVCEGERRYELWASHKQIAFRLIVPKGRVLVRADPKRIRQILNNLISNAIKFSNPGAQITLRLHEEEGRALVCVADTGQGISPEELDRVFATYEQASARATAGEHGSGLGLSIAKTLIELHGGEIWVESKPGLGAQFTFSLPV